MMKLVQFKATDGASVYVNPDQIAGIMPCQDPSGRVVVGTCGLLIVGSPPVIVAMGPDAAAKALGAEITAPPAVGAGFNGRLSS